MWSMSSRQPQRQTSLRQADREQERENCARLGQDIRISENGYNRQWDSDYATLISISTTFFPGAQLNQPPADLILLSSDSVFFYVHTSVLLSSSQNNFNNLLPLPPSGTSSSSASSSDLVEPDQALLPLTEPSDTLNVLLHTVYNISCAHYAPTLSTLSAALKALVLYSIPLNTYVAPQTPLFTTLLSQAPAAPLEVYALAAQYGLEDVAVSASPHLLSYQLSSLPDELAVQMGPTYLKRLFFLHLGRSEALKRLLLPPPHPHAPTQECDFTEQKKLTRAWALASAYLAWDARPDMAGSTLESALSPLAERLWCDQCRQSLQERVRQLIVQWSVVKVRFYSSPLVALC
ncbi:hypothetical protein M422DRAFT_57577 [Sphaerobolus stellatus SS14]|nr:hypothetical protein M422DRAFT_57577 [Sphaerobolus stellatus SS14]